MMAPPSLAVLYERSVLCDYLFWKFASRNHRVFGLDAYAVKHAAYEAMWRGLCRLDGVLPDAILYLRVDAGVCYSRKCKRDREAERDGVTDGDYIRELGDVHEYVYGGQEWKGSLNGHFDYDTIVDHIRVRGIPVIAVSSVDDVEVALRGRGDLKKVAIVGNIGAGKSTLLTQLSEKGYRVHLEPLADWSANGVDLLQAYNQNPVENAFPFQCVAFATRAFSWVGSGDK